MPQRQPDIQQNPDGSITVNGVTLSPDDLAGIQGLTTGGVDLGGVDLGTGDTPDLNNLFTGFRPGQADFLQDQARLEGLGSLGSLPGTGGGLQGEVGAPGTPTVFGDPDAVDAIVDPSPLFNRMGREQFGNFISTILSAAFGQQGLDPSGKVKGQGPEPLSSRPGDPGGGGTGAGIGQGLGSLIGGLLGLPGGPPGVIAGAGAGGGVGGQLGGLAGNTINPAHAGIPGTGGGSQITPIFPDVNQQQLAEFLRILQMLDTGGPAAALGSGPEPLTTDVGFQVPDLGPKVRPELPGGEQPTTGIPQNTGLVAGGTLDAPRLEDAGGISRTFANSISPRDDLDVTDPVDLPTIDPSTGGSGGRENAFGTGAEAGTFLQDFLGQIDSGVAGDQFQNLAQVFSLPTSEGPFGTPATALQRQATNAASSFLGTDLDQRNQVAQDRLQGLITGQEAPGIDALASTGLGNQATGLSSFAQTGGGTFAPAQVAASGGIGNEATGLSRFTETGGGTFTPEQLAAVEGLGNQATGLSRFTETGGGTFTPEQLAAVGGLGNQATGLSAFTETGGGQFTPEQLAAFGGIGNEATGLSNLVQTGGGNFGTSPEFAALEARSRRRLGEESAQLNELFGGLGNRFGSEVARGQGELIARFLENEALQRAQIGREGFADQRNRQLQALGLASGRDIASGEQELAGRGQDLARSQQEQQAFDASRARQLEGLGLLSGRDVEAGRQGLAGRGQDLARSQQEQQAFDASRGRRLEGLGLLSGRDVEAGRQGLAGREQDLQRSQQEQQAFDTSRARQLEGFGLLSGRDVEAGRQGLAERGQDIQQNQLAQQDFAANRQRQLEGLGLLSGRDVEAGRQGLAARGQDLDLQRLLQSVFADTQNRSLQGLNLGEQQRQTDLASRGQRQGEIADAFRIGEADRQIGDQAQQRQLAEFARTQGALLPMILQFLTAGVSPLDVLPSES